MSSSGSARPADSDETLQVSRSLVETRGPQHFPSTGDIEGLKYFGVREALRAEESPLVLHEAMRVSQDSNSALQPAVFCFWRILEVWPLRFWGFHVDRFLRGGLHRPVTGLRRNYPSNAASWVRDVSRVAGDQMDMRMHDGLAGGLSDVHTQVVSIWMQIRI